MSSHTIAPSRSILAVAAALLALVFCMSAFGISAASAASGGYGFKKASKAQKNSLKKAGRGEVSNQNAWFVTRSNSPRWGVVCGSTSSYPGMSYKRAGGKWKLSPPKGSGGIQTIIELCD